MLTLAEHFVETGLKVDLILAYAEGPYLSEVSEEINIINLKSRRIIFALPKLVKYLKNSKPSVLLSAMAHVNLIALLGKKIAHSNVRVAISEHTYYSRSIKINWSFRLWLMHQLVIKLYSKADMIIAVSNGVKIDLASKIAISPEKIKVIYNPVVTDNLIKKANEMPNHPWFYEKGIPVILGVGRLSKEKDYETLIKAFKLVLSKRQARLMILGEGKERVSLDILIAELSLDEKVSMPGFVANPYTYMNKSSLFVLSSRWEGLPNVLIEALACGCPVVSTDCPSGPAEILENGKYGPLVPVGDVEALAKAMNDVLNNPPEREMLKKRAMEFSVDEIGKQYLDVLFNI